MIHEYALLTIDPADAEAFDAVIPAAEQILLGAPGCLTAELQRSVDLPGTYLLRVGWERIEDHLEVFPTTPQSDRLAATIGGYFAADPIVAHFAR